MRHPTKNRLWLVSLFVAISTVVAVVVLGTAAAEPTYAREVRANLNQIMQDLDRPSDPQVALSSNPYDYIKDNPNYEAIVALGFEALPALEAELDSAKASGLREYIVCIAIEDITNCDLKQFPEFTWDRASAFKSRWDEYLGGMPERVSGILASSRPTSEKIAEIQRLGAPAVPYVIDAELGPDSATQGDLVRAVSAAFGEDADTDSLSAFGQQHSERVKSMRDYVEKH